MRNICTICEQLTPVCWTRCCTWRPGSSWSRCMTWEHGDPSLVCWILTHACLDNHSLSLSLITLHTHQVYYFPLNNQLQPLKNNVKYDKLNNWSVVKMIFSEWHELVWQKLFDNCRWSTWDGTALSSVQNWSCGVHHSLLWLHTGPVSEISMMPATCFTHSHNLHTGTTLHSSHNIWWILTQNMQAIAVLRQREIAYNN